ncbi:MAG: hypothetical protein H6R15_2002 [Proteobacteria bacterium]|nr:hypothetical protein [Pseudomonadota bacterium]
MSHRHSGCPLCGGKLTALDLLNACDELVDAELGVLSARCPYCQGRLEIRPAAGQIEIGYIVGANQPRFDVAFVMDCAGLEMLAGDEAGGLRLRTSEQYWAFREA